MKVLILGGNGFIGHHLSDQILNSKDWEVYAIDIASDRLSNVMNHPRFHFFEGDITINHEQVDHYIEKCDIIIPLAAIATPSTYITDPLRVFELVFEANLTVVRSVVQHGKRLVFPSTSEVYGMNTDETFDPETSNLVYGPISKTRWVYACAKQMMDRIIFAYGQQKGLQFTLFRPFNWIGPGLDSLATEREGSSRVVSRFFGDLLHRGVITLVDGGAQRRCFTCISDGIGALMRILENPQGVADGKIYNIGNPDNDVSIAELADRLIQLAGEIPAYAERAASVQIEVKAGVDFYGSGYQDATRRIPNIQKIRDDLGWQPHVGLDEALRRILEAHHEAAKLHP